MWQEYSCSGCIDIVHGMKGDFSHIVYGILEVGQDASGVVVLLLVADTAV